MTLLGEALAAGSTAKGAAAKKGAAEEKKDDVAETC